MKQHFLLYGFVIWIVASIATSVYVAPMVPWLTGLFGFAGTFAGILSGAALSFVVFVAFLWLASKAGIEAGVEAA